MISVDSSSNRMDQSDSSVSCPTILNMVPIGNLFYLRENDLLLSFTLGRLANCIRWYMHQLLLTGKIPYLTDLNKAYEDTKQVLSFCNKIDSIKINFTTIVDNFIREVNDEDAAEYWYDIYNSNNSVRHISDKIRTDFASCFQLAQQLYDALKPLSNTKQNCAYDLGFHLDQFIRPDISGYRQEQVIAMRSSTVEEPGSQIHEWEEHKRMLLEYASGLGISCKHFEHLNTDFVKESVSLRCNKVEQTATQLCNWFAPMLLNATRKISELLSQLDNRYRKAYSAYLFACNSNTSRISPADAFNWLEEHGWPHSSKKIRKKDTFCNYIRKTISYLDKNNVSDDEIKCIISQDQIDISGLNHVYST